MLIKNQEDTWITCAQCGEHLRASRGGACKCGEVEVSKPDKRGVQMIAGDDDLVIVEND